MYECMYVNVYMHMYDVYIINLLFHKYIHTLASEVTHGTHTHAHTHTRTHTHTHTHTCAGATLFQI
jgi:hypothetical protein